MRATPRPHHVRPSAFDGTAVRANAPVPGSVVPLRRSRPGVASLEQRRSLPTWLQALLKLQRSSRIVAGILLLLTVIAYGSTVYLQQLWGREYQRLQLMHSNQRRINTLEGVIKDQLAQQAEQPDTGLIPRNPNHLVFVSPAPERPPRSPAPVPDAAKSKSETPIGY